MHAGGNCHDAGTTPTSRAGSRSDRGRARRTIIFFAFERYQFVSNQDLANNTAQQKLGRVEASIAFRAAEMYKKWVPSSDRSHIPKLNKLLGTCQRQAFSLDAGYLLHDILGQALHPQREAATTEDPDAQLQGFAGRGSKVMQALAYIAAQ